MEAEGFETKDRLVISRFRRSNDTKFLRNFKIRTLRDNVSGEKMFRSIRFVNLYYSETEITDVLEIFYAAVPRL